MSYRKIDTLEFELLANSTLAKRLKFFRTELNKLDPERDYTITAIANKVGVTPQSISAIERGESKNPSFQLIHKLTKEYGIPLEAVTDEFYEDETLFTIGHPIEVDIDMADVEIVESPRPTLGFLVYQENNENEIRFVFNEEIPHVKDLDIIKLLSRLIYELEMYQAENSVHVSELFRKESPFDKSAKLYFATENVYPFVPKEHFSNLIRELTRNEYERE